MKEWYRRWKFEILEIVSLLTVLSVVVIFAPSKERQVDLTPRKIFCADIHSAFLDQGGWKRLTFIDQMEIEAGRLTPAEYTEEPSLRCWYQDNKNVWSIAYEKWYKPKEGRPAKASGKVPRAARVRPRAVSTE